jgi:hypothetical protein
MHVIKALLVGFALPVSAMVHAQASGTPAQQLDAYSKCVSAEAASPEGFRLTTLGIIGSGPPTAQHVLHDSYASAADSGMAMMYVSRMESCDALMPSLRRDPANNPAVKILTAFANGELTYGDAVALMKKQRQLMRAKLPPQP